MSFRLRIPEEEVFGFGKYVNAASKAECVEFVHQATDVPQMRPWERGVNVGVSQPGDILRGTVIATFDETGRYPIDRLGTHVAVYLGHDALHIRVLDQWPAQGEVRERPIYFKRPADTYRSNDAHTYYVVE